MVSEAVQTNGISNNGHQTGISPPQHHLKHQTTTSTQARHAQIPVSLHHMASKMAGYKLEVYNIDNQNHPEDGNYPQMIQYTSMPPGGREGQRIQVHPECSTKSQSGHKHVHRGSHGHLHHSSHHHQPRSRTSNHHTYGEHCHQSPHHQKQKIHPEKRGKLQKSKSDGQLVDDNHHQPSLPVNLQRHHTSSAQDNLEDNESDKEMPDLAPIFLTDRQSAMAKHKSLDFSGFSGNSYTLPHPERKPILKKQSTLPHTFLTDAVDQGDDLDQDLGQTLSPLGSTSSLQDLLDSAKATVPTETNKSEKLISASLWAEEDQEILPPITTDAIRTDTAIVYVEEQIQKCEANIEAGPRRSKSKEKSVTMVAPGDKDGSDSGRGTSEDHKKHGEIEEAPNKSLDEEQSGQQFVLEKEPESLSGDDTISLPQTVSNSSYKRQQDCQDEEKEDQSSEVVSSISEAKEEPVPGQPSLPESLPEVASSYGSVDSKRSMPESPGSEGMWAKIHGGSGGDVKRKRDAFEKQILNKSMEEPPRRQKLDAWRQASEREVPKENVPSELIMDHPSDEETTSQHLDSDGLFKSDDSPKEDVASVMSSISRMSVDPKDAEETKEEMKIPENPPQGSQGPIFEPPAGFADESPAQEQDVEKEKVAVQEKPGGIHQEPQKPVEPHSPITSTAAQPEEMLVAEELPPYKYHQEVEVEELASLCSAKELPPVETLSCETNIQQSLEAPPTPQPAASPPEPVSVSSQFTAPTTSNTSNRSSIKSSKSRSRSGSKERLLSKLADAENAPKTAEEVDEISGEK